MTIRKSNISNKQKKISYDRGFPANNFGEDGDITVRYISGLGLFLFIKVNSKWYNTRLSLFRPKGSENNEPVIIPVGRAPKRAGELSIDTSTKLRVGTGNGSNKQQVGINPSKVLDVEEIVLSRAKADGSDSTEDFLIKNTGTGRTFIHVQTSDANADPYLLLSYLQVGETNTLNQWAIGMDNSASDVLRFCYKSSGTSPLTPSTTTGSEIEMTLDGSGNLDIGGTLDISNVTEIGSDTDKFLMIDGTTVKYVTGANLATYAGVPTNFITNDADDIMNANLTLRKVSDDANSAELIFQKERSDTTIDDDDYVGKILFKAYDDQGTPEIMTAGEISTQVVDASSADEKAKMYFKVLSDEYMDVDNPTTFLSATGVSGGYSNIEVNIGSLASSTNYMHGQTVFTPSGHGTVNSDGKIHIKPYSATTQPHIKIESNADDGDYLKLAVSAAGASIISTVDDGGTEADLTLDPDGELNFTPVTEVKSDAPLKIKEAAAAVADTDTYGQIWVKNEDPEELYFTTGGGDDIQITSGTGLKTRDNPHVFQYGGLARTQYNNWYYGSSTTYGPNYYYYFSTTGSTATPSSWIDSIAPSFLVPRDGTITGYTIIGNNRSTDTWEWMCMKGAQPTFGSAGNWTMSQIGATQSAGGTANILYKWEQTGLSVAVSKNDMLALFFRRTTDNDTTYAYCEFNAYITME